MQETIHHLVSVSGGKDSTATLLLAQRQFPDEFSAVFADTGNEHPAVYEYLDYLERTLGITITRLRQNFAEWWWRRRDYIRDKWPDKGVSQTRVDEVVAFFNAGPSGNPYLDLCCIKGMFPSRKLAFCTQFLKTQPLTEHALWVIDTLADAVWSWQGVRRDESQNRRGAKGFEKIGGGLFAFRPIAGWSAQETVDFVRSCGLKLNPLYEQGMSRVGCMPCINANKGELAEISRRFPEHVDRIAEWESLVRSVAKTSSASFIPAPYRDGRGLRQGQDIRAVVRWAKTFRGGTEADPQWDEPAPQCSSGYGLCE